MCEGGFTEEFCLFGQVCDLVVLTVKFIEVGEFFDGDEEVMRVVCELEVCDGLFKVLNCSVDVIALSGEPCGDDETLSLARGVVEFFEEGAGLLEVCQ